MIVDVVVREPEVRYDSSEIGRRDAIELVGAQRLVASLQAIDPVVLEVKVTLDE